MERMVRRSAVRINCPAVRRMSRLVTCGIFMFMDIIPEEIKESVPFSGGAVGVRALFTL